MYRHYKGGLYTALYIGTHTETEERYVVYTDKDNSIWLRPLSMWQETVEYEGEIVQRFTRI